jgi:hypothetical protein
VPTDGRSYKRELRDQDVSRIAAAFELPRDVVLADVALVAEWPNTDDALLERLRDDHDWDDSMSPYYLLWLRGDGNDPPL